jgi:hypothetical protein
MALLRSTRVLPPWFAALATAVALLAAGSQLALADGHSFVPASSGCMQVETSLEVKGNLKLLVTRPGKQGEKSERRLTPIPVNVVAKLSYAACDFAQADNTILHHTLRHYTAAEASMEVGQGKIVSTLGNERRLIVVHDTLEQSDLFAPAGPLDRAEFELLSTPLDAGLLAQFLPPTSVAVGKQWAPASEPLARLLRLDRVERSDVVVKLARVDKNQAALTIQGSLSGEVDGVASEIELNGKLLYDLAAQRCLELDAELREVRAASQGTPGFETAARIRTKIAACETPAVLAEARASSLKTTPDAATRLLRYVAVEQGFELVHEPQWRIVADQPNLAVLRLLEEGDMVAQCNISRLTPLAVGEQLTLEGFQADLKRSLGGSLQEFVEGSESLNESGLRVLRVTAAAMVADVPIHYVFYHVSDDRQNRVSLAFTMDAELAERFARSDDMLVGSLLFRTPAEPAREARRPSRE